MGTPSSAADESGKQRRKSSRSSRPADASPKERSSGDDKQKEAKAKIESARRKSSRSSRPAESKERSSGDDKQKSKEESARRKSSRSSRPADSSDDKQKPKESSSRDKYDLRRHKSPDVKATSAEKTEKSHKRLSDEDDKRDRKDDLKLLRRSSHKRLSDEDDKRDRKDDLKLLRRSSHKRLSDEEDKKDDSLKLLRRSSHSNKMTSPNSSAGRKRLSDEEDKKDDNLKQLRRSSHTKKITSPNSSVGSKRLSEEEDKREELKQLRRSSHSGSVRSMRSMSSGKKRPDDEGEKDKKGSRSRLGGVRRKKKVTSADDDKDASDSDEEANQHKEKKSKRKWMADGAKRRLSLARRNSLERKASSGSNTSKSAPKRFSKALRRSSSDGKRYIGRSTANKEGASQPQPKRLSLDSSMTLLGKSFSDLDPDKKTPRSASVESQRRTSKLSKDDDQFSKRIRNTPTQQDRKSFRRSVNNTLEDLDASDDGSDSCEENNASPSDLRKSTRRISDSSRSIPKEFRKSRLDLFQQNTEDVQNARSVSVESSSKTKTSRRHTEKFKRKDPSQKVRRSNSIVLGSKISDKRKEFREKRRASIDASFARRKSAELAKLSSRKLNADKDDDDKDAVSESHSDREEESKTRAGESTSELESLLQKNASKSKTGSVKSVKSSTKSPLSSDKKDRKKKKRKKKRKWFSFCCCAIVLLALVIVGIIFMIGRAYYKAEAEEEKAELTKMVIGMGTPEIPEIVKPSPAPTASKVLAQPSVELGEDVAVVVIVQLDGRPDETGFSLISADNTTTYVYYPFGSLSGQQSEVITEVLSIPANTEVIFTFTDKSGAICCDDGNGYYRVFTGSGESKKSLISGDRNSEYRFKVGSDTAVQTGGIDPNESCKPCPDGKECGRCAWCNADRGFLPDTIFSYQCHTPPISIAEKCFIGAKRVQLHNQYVAAMAKCTNGFEPWPQLQSTSEMTLCVSEAKCIQKYAFVDPDCESELSGSLLVRESCQDVIGGLAFGYDFGFNAPRKNECLPGPYSMAEFAEAIASRCCVDGVAFCSAFDENSIASDAFASPQTSFTGPEPTLSPTTSLRPTVSNGYLMTIVIMLDNFPRETGWSITSKDSITTYMKRSPGYYREPQKLIVETVPLPEGSNTIFTITDEEGDGSCCLNGEGYFQIYTADGSLIVDESGAFASSKSVDVFAGKPLTLSPTVSLAPSSSSAPTQGLYPITIVLKFDQWATETGISITSLDGNVLYEWAQGSFVEPNERFVQTIQLPYESEVIFSAIDSGGDGFCCVYGDGSITILAGDDAEDQSAVIDSRTGEFQSELSFSFRVGPAPTSAPTVTLVPTVANTNDISESPTITSQPTIRSLEVTVVVQFDKYSAETGFFIDSADGMTNYVARPLGYYQNEQSKKVVETFILPEGLNYRFKIIDLFGDGTCCWAGAGYYAVYEGKNIDDISTQLFYGDGEFGLAREHFFTVGNAQTLSPSSSQQPSAPPTISPTSKPSISSSPTETMYIVDMTIKLDSNALETGFFIASVADGTVYFDRPTGYYNGMDKETIEESIPLPAGQYEFTLLDAGGDGFCCQQGFGFYSLYENASGDVLVFSDGQFGDSKTETFSVGEAITRSVTKGLRGSIPHRQRNHVD